MVRIETRGSLEHVLKRNHDDQVVVAVYSTTKDVFPDLSSLADSLQHTLGNMTKARESTDVVIVDHEVCEVRIWKGRRLMHVINNPSERSVVEAYRIVRGHYDE